MERKLVDRKDFYERTKQLMHDRNFLIGVAEACDVAYKLKHGEPPTPLFSPEEKDEILSGKPVDVYNLTHAQVKLAKNIGGFYATEIGVSDLANDLIKEPEEILKNIASDSPDPYILREMTVYARTAWLGRVGFAVDVTDEDVVPYNLLPPNRRQLDTDQIVAAGRYWYSRMNT